MWVKKDPGVTVDFYAAASEHRFNTAPDVPPPDRRPKSPLSSPAPATTSTRAFQNSATSRAAADDPAPLSHTTAKADQPLGATASQPTMPLGSRQVNVGRGIGTVRRSVRMAKSAGMESHAPGPSMSSEGTAARVQATTWSSARAHDNDMSDLESLSSENPRPGKKVSGPSKSRPAGQIASNSTKARRKAGLSKGKAKAKAKPMNVGSDPQRTTAVVPDLPRTSIAATAATLPDAVPSTAPTAAPNARSEPISASASASAAERQAIESLLRVAQAVDKIPDMKTISLTLRAVLPMLCDVLGQATAAGAVLGRDALRDIDSFVYTVEGVLNGKREAVAAYRELLVIAVGKAEADLQTLRFRIEVKDEVVAA